MDRNLLVLLLVAVGAGAFLAGRTTAKPDVAPAAAKTPAAEAAKPPAPVPPEPAPEPSRPAAPAVTETPVPATPERGAVMSDEQAGKGVDLAKIAKSPATGGASLGADADKAYATVIIFSDFQCPVCRRSADPVKQLAADFPGEVRVVFRHNALAMHGRAEPAALAAVAAQKQGKFWQYHDKLFANQGAMGDADLEKYAKELGLDVDKWKKDKEDPATKARVAEERGWADTMEAQGTPSFFVNGIKQVGWGSYLAIRAQAEKQIAEAKKLEAAGTTRAKLHAEMIKKNAAKEAKDVGAWVKALTAP